MSAEQECADRQARGAWWCPDLEGHRSYRHADGRWYCDACLVDLGGFRVTDRRGGGR